MKNVQGRRALALTAAIAVSSVIGTSGAALSAPAGKSCSEDTAGLSLPGGFCATIFADKLGHVRQIAFAPDGTLYVNTWSGPYYKDNALPAGGFLVALKDSKGTGSADIVERFGETPSGGGHGGTGIAVYNNYVYAEINDRIVRYQLKGGDIAPDGKGETVLSDMPTTLDHPMHPFIIRPDGALFVDMGSTTNACEIKNRMPHSKGHEPCNELETRAGTWKYDANKLDQKFSPSERYATGIRNGEGFDFDADGNLYVTQHGRDQLHEDWPELYSAQQGYELPSEEVVMLKEGGDYGWPYCYFDGSLGKLVLAPEYGGDGKSVGQCAQKIAPVASFPGHWAPNDMKIYKSEAFPEAYRGGMFIAFHGSWNRAPGPQGGYSVIFQPFAKGRASGKFVLFADGFAGQHKNPGEAAHRPSGLAIAPDGDLYVSDDVTGRIWRIAYVGDLNAKELNAAPAVAVEASHETNVLPPEGIHPDAGGGAALPVPPGGSAELVAVGQKVFNGDIGGATCAGCHSDGGVGSPVGADLTAGKWIWSDGSLDGLTKTIKSGVPQPKFHLGAMPPMGGVTLSDDQVKAVAAYVWALGHQK
jgi:glucose/arabinose dehydrogenase/mono/diheme cytochrome c family protein